MNVRFLVWVLASLLVYFIVVFFVCYNSVLIFFDKKYYERVYKKVLNEAKTGFAKKFFNV